MESQSDELYDEWLERWLEEDFSWEALQTKQRWLAQEGTDVQAQIRKFEGNHSDPRLIGDGKLVLVAGFRLYHVAFIPSAWARSDLIDLSEDELRERQSQFWNRVIGSELRDTYSGTITGVSLPDEAAAHVMSSTRASFLWCSLDSARLTLSRRGMRIFDRCYFHKLLKLTGNFAASESKPSLKMSSCVLSNGMEIKELHDIAHFQLDECRATTVDLKHSQIAQARLDACNIGRFSAWDTSIGEKFITAHCEFGLLELISSKFDNDVEFIECEIKDVIDIVRCDFARRGRLSSAMAALRAQSL